MAAQFGHYLANRYGGVSGTYIQRRSAPRRDGVFVCVDDRDDNDSLTDFCNIFCSAVSSKGFRLELTGKFPITDGMADLARQHGGSADPARGRLVLNIPLDKPETADQLARLVKTTANHGSLAGNPAWFRVCARTVSSLLRLGRVMREYAEEG